MEDRRERRLTGRGRGLLRRRLRLTLVFAGVTRIELFDDIVGNSFEHFTRESSKQLPTNIQRIRDGSILISTCKTRESEGEGEGEKGLP